MTISKKQLEDAKIESYAMGKNAGICQGKEAAKKEFLYTRQDSIVDLTKAAAELAMANAKLTYAMSRIADKLL